MKKLRIFVSKLVRETFTTSVALFKITLPISALTKLLTDFGATDMVGSVLGSLMGLFGLPGEMGLVWASALLTNLYGGLSVFATLPQIGDLTIAQVSVLTTMMLMAHGLPVEMMIARKAGVRLRFSLFVRGGGALLAGLVLHGVYQWTGWLNQPCQALWQPPKVDAGWLNWALAQGQNMLAIAGVIMLLLVVMHLLEFLGVIRLLTRWLRPLLVVLGMSDAAAPVTMIGMFLGLSYGGGLIIQEARSGKLPVRDVVLSLSLMGLCHSVIEDTLLMGMVGGHWSAILAGRILISLLVVMGLRLVLQMVPLTVLRRYVYA